MDVLLIWALLGALCLFCASVTGQTTPTTTTTTIPSPQPGFSPPPTPTPTPNPGGSVGGDPHILQYVVGSDNMTLPLCYDVYGQEGDIYQFVKYEDDGLQINGQLTSLGIGNRSLFIGALSLITPDLPIFIDINKIEIDGVSLPWAPHSKLYPTETSTAVVIIEENKAYFEFGSSNVTVEKTRKFLNFEVDQMEESDTVATGIIGDVFGKTEIVNKGEAAELVVIDSNSKSLIELNPKPNCWKVPFTYLGEDSAFGKLIQTNKVGCLAC